MLARMTISKRQREAANQKVSPQGTRSALNVKTGLRVGVVEAEAPIAYDGYSPEYYDGY
jgi:hypothetical protein